MNLKTYVPWSIVVTLILTMSFDTSVYEKSFLWIMWLIVTVGFILFAHIPSTPPPPSPQFHLVTVTRPLVQLPPPW